MSTLTGHSLLQALQERHRSRASRTASLCQSGVEDPALHQLPEQVRAAARGVLLLPRRHVTGTHGARAIFATGSHANAPQRRFAKRAVIVGELKERLRLLRLITRAEAQILVRLIDRGAGGIDHLAGVHAIVGVPQRFKVAKSLHQLGRQTFLAEVPPAPAHHRARRRWSRRARSRCPWPDRGRCEICECPGSLSRSKLMRVCTHPWPKWPYIGLR